MTGAGTGAVPAPPRSAEEYFGASLAAVERYAALLAGPGAERGLIGPREVPRLWERHLLNCAVVHEAIPPGASVVDVGSGAGLPGVVIALIRPDLTITMVEPLLRRSRYLDEVVTELELPHVSVLRARAEDLHGNLTADVATARAVAPLDRLARWTLPLLRHGGRLLALKGASADEEVTNTRDAMRRAGAGAIELVEYGVGVIEPVTRVVVVERAAQKRSDGSRRGPRR